MYQLKIEIIPGPGESPTTFQGAEHKDYSEQFNQLYDTYELAVLRTTHPYHITELKAQSEWAYRFCKKKAGQVKFKNVGRLIPELLGNKSLFSDVECDSCNKRFGKYENYLANYLGVVRTMSGVKSKDGVPKFQSPDESFIIQLGDIPDVNNSPAFIIESIGEYKKHFTFDESQKRSFFTHQVILTDRSLFTSHY